MFRNKILLLDEATASLDLRTDHLIQRTIQTSFASCTVLTIAHRINSVMDYDKVLVLDQGQVVEMGTHQELLDKEGKYSNLWRHQQETDRKQEKKAEEEKENESE